MVKKDFELLKSYPFIISLTLLLLNDLFLKSHYPCWITGKLSDFTGLFVFPIFWAVFFPKYKKLIFLSTGLLFIIWNSPIIQPILNQFHLHQIWIDRTVDYSDNITLVSLFIAYRFMQNNKTGSLNIRPAFICLISLFAFTATTLTPREKIIYQINEQYDFDISLDNLCQRINNLGDKYFADFEGQLDALSTENLLISKYSMDTVYQKIDLQNVSPSDTIEIIANYSKIRVWGDDSKSSILLEETLWYKKFHKDKDYSKKAEREFRRLFINELKKK